MSSKNANSLSKRVVDRKNKSNDNNNKNNSNDDTFNDDRRLQKKSKVNIEDDINDNEHEDNFDYSLFDTIFNTEDLLRDDINKLRDDLGPSHYQTIQAMNILAKHYCTEHYGVDAKLILTEIEDILKSTPERSSVETIKLKMLMARSYSTNALDNLKSKTILLDCHARRNSLSPVEMYETADSLDQLAAHYVRENNYAEAEQLLNESYEYRRRYIGSMHHDTLSTMYQLAKVNLQLQTGNIGGDNFNKAVSLLRRCLRAIQIEEADGHHHVQIEEAEHKKIADTEKITNTLADAYGKCGAQEQANLHRCIFEIKQQKLLNKDQYTKEMQVIEYEENERELEGLYLDTESALGVNHAETLDVMSQLADAYLANKMYDKAEIVLKRLLERYLDTNDTNNYDTLRTMTKLVNTLTIEKKYFEASRYLSHLKSRENQSEFFMITTLELQARNYVEQGKHQEAIDEFEKIIKLRNKSTHNEVKKIDNMKTYKELLSQYYKLQDTRGVIRTLKNRLRLAHEYYGKCALITLEERNILAGHLNLCGQSTQVELILNDYEILNTHHNDIAVFMQVLYSIDHLSTAYEKQGRMTEASNLLETSLNVRQMRLVNRNDLDTDHVVHYSMDLLTTDDERQEKITVATNLMENSLNEQQMRLANKVLLETHAIRIRLGRMYLAMMNGSRALHHLNIAKEVQNTTSNTVDTVEIDDLIVAAQEMGETIK